MLVLSRKENETIHIGHNVTLTVLSVRGGVAKLGINAPKGVRILRGELAKFIPVPPLEEQPHSPSEALAV